MKRALFIVGPALGHVGRLGGIAQKLRSVSEVEIIFATPAHGRYAPIVLGNDFEIIPIKIGEQAMSMPANEFAIGLEQTFRTIHPDLIVRDLCPLRWMSAVRYPDCPHLNVTNFFLTRHLQAQTFQTMRYADIASDIRRLRCEKGLVALESVFDLYGADRVLLADPQLLLNPYGELPAHYRICGACSWSQDGELPSELEPIDDVLLISMGSTGGGMISKEMIRTLAQRMGCITTVYAGGYADTMRELSVADYCYDWLPLKKMLPRARAVICQGGTGTSYMALEAGVPVIVIPGHRNHQILGELLEKAGVGLCIRRDSYDLNSALSRCENIVANASSFAAEMKQQGGVNRIVSQIREYL